MRTSANRRVKVQRVKGRDSVSVDCDPKALPQEVPRQPAMPSRRFPPPWSADEADSNLDRRSFIVRNANGQALAYVYFEGELDRRSAAHFRDEVCWGL